MSDMLYVGLQDDDKIVVFALDGDSGKLTKRADVAAAGGPSVMAISPDRNTLYVGCRTRPSIASYRETLEVEAFVPCDQVDDVYFDRPYYLAPATPTGADAFALMRDGIAKAKVAAVARTVLFRRVRSVLIRAHGVGLIAHTLNFD
jgi:DNA end-binding protein Ku